MSKFNQDSFNRFIIENDVLGFFEKPLRLKSGRTSHWYVNWRTVSEDVFLLDALSEFVCDFTRTLVQTGKLPEPPRCFYGVPEGATKLGVLTQYKWAKASSGYGKGTHVLPMGRTIPKEHGVPKDRYFLGMPSGGTIVIEDVTTTGGSLLSTLDRLIEADVPILAACTLTHRMERRDDGKSVDEAVAERNSRGKSVPLLHMSSALELLPDIFAKQNPGESVARSIEEEFKNYGMKSLSLL